MKLPNADNGIVDRAKIVDYLLNASHPDNSGKAAFFLDLGFKREDWEALAASLRQAAVNHDYLKSVASHHGRKYIVLSRIDTPCGKMPLVQTVWIVDQGFDLPRLVTAYPCGE